MYISDYIKADRDDIFEHVHTANRIADETEGVIRISIDTKAIINVGPFSRGGYSRHGVNACDHDFKPDTVLKPFGIFLPAIDENYFYFTESNATADFMIDALEDLWPSIKARFNPHTIAVNADNGPENNSRRSQFFLYYSIDYHLVQLQGTRALPMLRILLSTQIHPYPLLIHLQPLSTLPVRVVLYDMIFLFLMHFAILLVPSPLALGVLQLRIIFCGPSPYLFS